MTALLGVWVATDAEPTEVLELFLSSVRPGEVRIGAVIGFADPEVIVDLDGRRLDARVG